MTRSHSESRELRIDASLVDDENEEEFASHGLTSDQILQVLENEYFVAEQEATSGVAHGHRCGQRGRLHSNPD